MKDNQTNNHDRLTRVLGGAHNSAVRQKIRRRGRTMAKLNNMLQLIYVENDAIGVASSKDQIRLEALIARKSAQLKAIMDEAQDSDKQNHGNNYIVDELI